MKRIFFISSFILSFSICKSQNIPAQGTYITNNTMGAFHGTWQWVSGTDTVKIYLVTKKVHFQANGGFDWDCLVGWHIYKKGNAIIESSYSGINNIAASSINVVNEVENPNTREVGGSLTDLTKSKSGNLTFTLDPTGNLLVWKLENSPGVRIRTKSNIPPYNWSFTLPQNMIFVKQ